MSPRIDGAAAEDGDVRDVAVNELVLDALTRLLAVLEPVEDSEPLFRGHKRGTRLTVSTLS